MGAPRLQPDRHAADAVRVLGGAPLVTFVTALAGGLLACAAVAAHRAYGARDGRRSPVLAAAALAAVAALFGEGC